MYVFLFFWFPGYQLAYWLGSLLYFFYLGCFPFTWIRFLLLRLRYKKKDLHWLSVKDRIIYKIAVLVYYIINNNSSPSYPKELITVYTPQTQRSLRSSQKSLLEVPRKNLKTFGERSFSHTAPEVEKITRIHKVFPIYSYL